MSPANRNYQNCLAMKLELEGAMEAIAHYGDWDTYHYLLEFYDYITLEKLHLRGLYYAQEKTQVPHH